MAAVYPNLAGEIAKRGIKKCVLAKEAGISDRVLRNKMAGKGSFSIQEAIEIKSYYVEGGFSHLIHMTAAHLW